MPKRLTNEQRGPLGSRLYAARREQGLEQSQMAALIGISTAAYARWETGVTPQPEVAHLSKAAKILGVSVGYLLAGENTLANTDAFDQVVQPLMDELQRTRLEMERQLEELRSELQQQRSPD